MKSLSQHINESLVNEAAGPKSPIKISFDIVLKNGVSNPPKITDSINELISSQIWSIVGYEPKVTNTDGKSVSIEFTEKASNQLIEWYGSKLKGNITQGVKEIFKSSYSWLDYGASIKTLKFS